MSVSHLGTKLSRLRFCFAVLSLASAVFASSASAAPSTPIAEARELPLGSTVTVTGSVTTPSGAFESSFFDQGFALQDASGGIYVSVQENLGLQPRARARVTGVLAESFGLLILVPATTDDVKKLGRGREVEPLSLATSEVGESTEGLLVQVTGVITQAVSSDLPYGYKLTVDDGSGPVLIFINVQTNIDVTALTLGQEVTVTGFSSQFDDHYEIDPRSPSDIVVLTD